MNFDDVKNLAVIIGVFISVLTLAKGVFEYSRHLANERAEYFFALEKRLVDNENFLKILGMLEFDDPAVSTVPFVQKRELIGLFEEVAIMMNSKFMRKEVALYFFGYYAIDCWNSDPFCHDIDRNSPYWIVFREFVATMKTIPMSTIGRSSQYRF